MANEKLMEQLSEGIEKADTSGLFHIKTYPKGPHSIVVLTPELVTCGGPDGKERANKLASALNEVWNKHFDDLRNRDVSDKPTSDS